jgi:hypothetical protein
MDSRFHGNDGFLCAKVVYSFEKLEIETPQSVIPVKTGIHFDFINSLERQNTNKSRDLLKR